MRTHTHTNTWSCKSLRAAFLKHNHVNFSNMSPALVVERESAFAWLSLGNVTDQLLSWVSISSCNCGHHLLSHMTQVAKKPDNRATDTFRDHAEANTNPAIKTPPPPHTGGGATTRREDDVFTFPLLTLSCSLGALLCLCVTVMFVCRTTQQDFRTVGQPGH